MVGNNLIMHTREGDTIQILGVTYLNASQIETHHSRIVATDILHITAVGLVFPRYTIERIVLMAHHITFLL